MSYLTFFLLGIIGGLMLSVFFINHHLKNEKQKADKGDIEKISKELEEIKTIYKENYNFLEAEKEFYEEVKN